MRATVKTASGRQTGTIAIVLWLWVASALHPSAAVGETSTASGTAWPVTESHIVTSNHVVAGTDTVHLVTVDGQRMQAYVVVRDETSDIAVLVTDNPDLIPVPLPLTTSDGRLGASVFTIGFPRVDVMGEEPKLTVGIISGENGVRDDFRTYQTSVPIQPGNSGGPLLNMRGEVVGVVTSMLGVASSDSDHGQPLPNISYAVKSRVLTKLLQLVPDAKPLRRAKRGRGKESLENLAERLRGSVMLVIAESRDQSLVYKEPKTSDGTTQPQE